MKIKSINPVGKRPVYDISVEEAEHYVLSNGVITHNTGGMLSAMQVFFIGKSQEKDSDDELIGWNFTINIEKSRFVKEKSKFVFQVMYGTGIKKTSGLFELALESGHLVQAKKGWYQSVDMDTGEVSEKSFRKSSTDSNAFWEPILKDPRFTEFVENKFLVSSGDMIETDDVNDVYEDIDEEGED